MKKEKEKEIKLLLQQWGDAALWVNNQKNRYNSIIKVWNDGQENALDDIGLDKCRRECSAMAEDMFHNIRGHIMLKNKVENALEQLDFLERDIIILRHCKKIKWECISAHLPYYLSTRQYQRIYKTALEKLEPYL